MVVVAHDHVGVELPPATLNRLKDRALKRFTGVFRQEQFLAVIAPTDDVVDGTGKLDALLAWHPESMTYEGEGSNI